MSRKKMAGSKEEARPYKVYAIEDGVVIDHIPAKKAFDVVNVLGATEGNSIVTLGINLESKQLGRKDVVKIEKKNLSRNDLMKIALIAPKATINLIRGHKVTEKLKIDVPKVFEEIIRCPNPECITNHEPAGSRFLTVSEEPFRLKCHFCERTFERDEVVLL